MPSTAGGIFRRKHGCQDLERIWYYLPASQLSMLGASGDLSPDPKDPTTWKRQWVNQ
jgi:hypothetical protein